MSSPHATMEQRVVAADPGRGTNINQSVYSMAGTDLVLHEDLV